MTTFIWFHMFWARRKLTSDQGDIPNIDGPGGGGGGGAAPVGLLSLLRWNERSDLTNSQPRLPPHLSQPRPPLLLLPLRLLPPPLRPLLKPRLRPHHHPAVKLEVLRTCLPYVFRASLVAGLLLIAILGR